MSLDASAKSLDVTELTNSALPHTISPAIVHVIYAVAEVVAARENGSPRRRADRPSRVKILQQYRARGARPSADPWGHCGPIVVREISPSDVVSEKEEERRRRSGGRGRNMSRYKGGEDGSARHIESKIQIAAVSRRAPLSSALGGVDRYVSAGDR